MPTLEERVRALEDKQEIEEVVLRYGRGLDRLDWDIVRSCYHPDAFDDSGVHAAPVDEFIAWSMEFVPSIADLTMHVTGNVLIDLDGDRANVESYVVGLHRKTGEDGVTRDMIVGARNLDRFERRDGAWKIAHRTLVYEWSREDPVLVQWPVEPSFTVGRRDRDDLVYHLAAAWGPRE